MSEYKEKTITIKETEGKVSTKTLSKLAKQFGNRTVNTWTEFEEVFLENTERGEMLKKEIHCIKPESQSRLLYSMLAPLSFPLFDESTKTSYMELDAIVANSDGLDFSKENLGFTYTGEIKRITFVGFNGRMEQLLRAYFSSDSRREILGDGTRIVDYLYKPFEFHAILPLDKDSAQAFANRNKDLKPREKVEFTTGSAFRLRIYKKSNESSLEKSLDMLKCHLIYCASPERDLYAYISVDYFYDNGQKRSDESKEAIQEIVKEAVEKNPITDNKFADDNEINSMINIIKETDSLKVCSVGQANCIFGTTAENKITKKKYHYYFDIGLPIYSNEERMTSIEKGKCNNVVSRVLNGKNTQPEFIILSHWHYDHLSGAMRLKQNRLNNINWLAIEDKYYSYADDYLYRAGTTILEAYLIQNDLIRYVKTSKYQGNKIYSDDDVGLFWGTGNKKRDDINTEGLILRIKNVLLPGDTVYKFWPKGYAQRGSQKNVLSGLLFHITGVRQMCIYLGLCIISSMKTLKKMQR